MSKYLWLALILTIWTLPIQAQSIRTDAIEAPEKIAALIHKLYFYVDFPVQPETPEYCFIGNEASDIAQAFKKRQAHFDALKEVKVSTWESPESIQKFQCQIIYTGETEPELKPVMRELSSHALTIGSGTNLKDIGIISSITFEDGTAKLNFSRRNLKRTNIRINSQLIRVSNLLP